MYSIKARYQGSKYIPFRPDIRGLKKIRVLYFFLEYIIYFQKETQIKSDFKKRHTSQYYFEVNVINLDGLRLYRVCNDFRLHSKTDPTKLNSKSALKIKILQIKLQFYK